MPTQLPDNLISELAAGAGEPVPVVDRTGQTFYLVPEERLTQLEAAANRHSEATLSVLRKLLAEGEAAPDIDAGVVHAELMSRAKAIDASAP